MHLGASDFWRWYHSFHLELRGSSSAVVEEPSKAVEYFSDSFCTMEQMARLENDQLSFRWESAMLGCLGGETYRATRIPKQARRCTFRFWIHENI